MCGEDRVFHNDRAPQSVAIRWTNSRGLKPEDPPDEKFIIGKAEGVGEGHDAAGRKAAKAFAAKVRERGQELLRWASLIDDALAARDSKKEGT